MFTLGAFLWILHSLIIDNSAVILANICTLVFAAIIIFYKIKYKDGITSAS